MYKKRKDKVKNEDLDKNYVKEVKINDETLIKLIEREKRSDINNDINDPKRNTGFCNARLEWDKIRNDYISGWYDENNGEYIYPTYEKLANKYNCSIATVSKKGMDENWNKMRLLLKSKIKERRTYNEIKEVIGIAAKFDSCALESISDSYEILQTYLHKTKKVMVEDEIDDMELVFNSDIANNIMKVTNSIEKLVNMNRKILADDTNHKSLQNELKELKEELTKDLKLKEEQSNSDNLIDMQKRLEEIQSHRKNIISKKKL